MPRLERLHRDGDVCFDRFDRDAVRAVQTARDVRGDDEAARGVEPVDDLGIDALGLALEPGAEQTVERGIEAVVALAYRAHAARVFAFEQLAVVRAVGRDVVGESEHGRVLASPEQYPRTGIAVAAVVSLAAKDVYPAAARNVFCDAFRRPAHEFRRRRTALYASPVARRHHGGCHREIIHPLSPF